MAGRAVSENSRASLIPTLSARCEHAGRQRPAGDNAPVPGRMPGAGRDFPAAARRIRPDSSSHVIASRADQVLTVGAENRAVKCEAPSTAGAVSQRACVFCGSRVVLYPIADALHLVHGPVGCAAYTWDIRGALSSGPELHRVSFCTDLREREVIFGGVEKLERTLDELIPRYSPRAAFVYATCIVGIIGDDVDAVCRRVQARHGIPVIPVHSEGFRGTKKDGYRAACAALGKLVGTGNEDDIAAHHAEPGRAAINILGEFNLAGESWIINDYYRKMGIDVVAVMTGDGRVDRIANAHRAQLNLVQCSGSLTPLAEMMEERFGIPFKRVSYFGLEDTAGALYEAADFFGNADIKRRTEELVCEEVENAERELVPFRERLRGKRAAIYVGGAFKAFSLIKLLRRLGMEVVLAGSQTGNSGDYERLVAMCPPGTVIVDDSNPLELCRFLQETGADLMIGGVKERPLAYKLGIGFCDHNHERKIPLAGFVGAVNFAREVARTVTSPVWGFIRGRRT